MSKANRRRRYRVRRSAREFLENHARSIAMRPRQLLTFAELEAKMKEDPMWRRIAEARYTYFTRILPTPGYPLGYTITKRTP